MKRQLSSQLITLATTFALAATSLAQGAGSSSSGTTTTTPPSGAVGSGTSPGTATTTNVDGIFMRNGAVYFLKDGRPQRIERETRLSEGITIDNNGNVTLKDGSKTKLTDGQMITLDGKTTTIPSGIDVGTGTVTPGTGTGTSGSDTGTSGGR